MSDERDTDDFSSARVPTEEVEPVIDVNLHVENDTSDDEDLGEMLEDLS